MNQNTLNYPLPKFLFILFHELAHQFQYKKYGEEKMLELYLQRISISEAAKFMFNVENVADEFGVRKIQSLKRKGLIDFSKNDVIKGYENSSPSKLEFFIRGFREQIKSAKINDTKEISEFLYNIIKSEV
jgi:hypothetical protein